MNYEQLSDIASRAGTALQATNTIKRVSRLVESLNKLVTNAADSGAASEYQQHLKNLRAAAEEPVMNVFSRREIEIMRPMRIAEAAGSELASTVRAIAEDPKYLLQNKRDAFVELQNRLNSIIARLKKFDEVSKELNLEVAAGGPADTGKFDAEFSWFVPRSDVELSISELRKEFRNIEALISCAGVLVEKPGYKIVYLSASDFGVYVVVAKQVADFIVDSLVWLSQKYADLQTIRKSLRSAKLSEGLKKQVEAELGGASEEQLTELAREAIQETLGRADLQNDTVTNCAIHLSIALTKIKDGRRIDVKYIKLSDPVATEAGAAESPEAAAERLGKLAELTHKLDMLEARVQDLPALPPPPEIKEG